MDEILNSGRLGQLTEGIYEREAGLTDEGRRRLEEALVTALNGPEDKPIHKTPKDNSRPRIDRVITAARIYIKRIGKKELESFQQTYSTVFNRLSPESYDAILSELNTAANNANQLDERASSHQGAKFGQFVELLDALLLKHGQETVVGPSHGLFRDHEG